MTEGVNRGILEAHRKGIVSSTTLLANGAAFEAAVAAGREASRQVSQQASLRASHLASNLGIGVHLNLSEGLPISHANDISTLLDAAGRLHLTPGRLWWAMASRRVRLAEIEIELRAQVNKVIAAGITPTHLDGHMHVHVLPGVAEIVVRIARESGVAAVRCPVEPVGSVLRRFPDNKVGRLSMTWKRLGTLAASGAALRLRRLLEKAGLAHPARFYGIVATGLLNLRVLKEILRSLPAGSGVSELMCHPGYVDDHLASAGGGLQTQRETELQALTSPEVIELAAAQEIRLLTYREFAESAPGREAAA